MYVNAQLTQSVVEIPYGALEKMLRLPDNCKVVSVRRVPNDEALEIKIDGPLLSGLTPVLKVGDATPLQPIPFANLDWSNSVELLAEKHL